MVEKVNRLCIYLNEANYLNGRPLWQVVLEFLKAEGCAGATVYRGIAGYGGTKIVIQDSNLPAENMPVMIELIESAITLEEILPRLDELVFEGLITLQEVEVYKYSYRREPPSVFATIRVREAMTPRDYVAKATADMPLYRAVALLLGKPYKALPVVDGNNKLIGIVADHDISIKGRIPYRLDHMEAMGIGPGGQWEALYRVRDNPLTVGDVMTTQVITATPEMTLQEAGRLMNAKHMKRLPVVDDTGILIGILSRYDVLREGIGVTRNTVENISEAVPLPNFHLKVKEAMTTDFPVVSVQANLFDALTRLMDAKQHRIVVVDEQGKGIGILTEGDMIARVDENVRADVLHALGRKMGLVGGEFADSLLFTSVGDLVYEQMVSVRPGVPLAEAIRQLVQEKIKILPVLDDADKPVGVLTRREALQALFDKVEA